MGKTTEVMHGRHGLMSVQGAAVTSRFIRHVYVTVRSVHRCDDQLRQRAHLQHHHGPLSVTRDVPASPRSNFSFHDTGS